MNPILEVETRVRRRMLIAVRARGKVTFYAGVVTAFLFYVWLMFLSFDPNAELALVVKNILIVQLAIVTIVVPFAIGGAISAEREKSTWEALVVTRLTPGQIIVGKLTWRIVGLISIMVLVAGPLAMCADSAFPGMSDYCKDWTPISALVTAEVMTFAWGLLLCSFGLWVSSSARSKAASYATIWTTLLAAVVLAPVLSSILAGSDSEPDCYVGVCSSIQATSSDPAVVCKYYSSHLVMDLNAFYALESIATWSNYKDPGPIPEVAGNTINPINPQYEEYRDLPYEPLLCNGWNILRNLVGSNSAANGEQAPPAAFRWGLFQIAMYLSEAALFLNATYRTLHKRWVG